MIDQATKDRIYAAIDIVDVVSEFVTLKRSGANYKGLCPFHDEKTPSFMVSPSKQVCKCFSCGEGGSAVNFVMKHEQLSYPEALKWLARKYGIEVRERELSDEERAVATAREGMLVVNEWARDYFMNNLNETVDGKAIGMSYFRRRGLRDDIIRKFQLGYALEQRDAMAVTARQKGFEEKYVEGLGLCFRTNDGKLLDRYHGRVIFPIHSVSGRVVGFGGRFLGDEKAKGVGKYVNSPESEIYSKKRELYGLYTAKQAIVKHDCCYLVEGYLDVISLYQSGIENVVASSGTALTKEQVRLIHRFTSNVTVLYDGDTAGIKASLRGIDILLEEGLNIKVLLLPNGEDPDSFAQKHSPEELRQYIEQHQTDFMQFKTELLMKDTARDPLQRANVIADIVRSIAVIPSEIVRQVYIHELAYRLGIDEQIIVQEVASAIRAHRSQPRRTEGSSTGRTAPAAGSPTPAAPTAPAAPVAPDDGPPIFLPDGEVVEPAAPTQPALVVSPTLATQSVAERTLQACERFLVELVVRYAQFPLIAPKKRVVSALMGGGDEIEEVEDSPIVIHFVAAELEAEGIQLKHPIHQRILDEALQGVETEGFESRAYFLTHADMAVAQLAEQLLSEPYMLSQSQQQQYTPDEQRLMEIVPRVVNDYKHALLLVQKEAVMLALRAPGLESQPERVDELLRQLTEINEVERIFAKVLGDRVLPR